MAQLQHLTFQQARVPDRREVQYFAAGEALAVGDAVGLDLSKSTDPEKAVTVVKCIGGATPPKVAFVGVVLEAAAAGAVVPVCVRGMCEANCGATTAGDVLVTDASTGTAGRLVPEGTASAGTLQCAIDLDGGAAGLHTVWVL